MEVVLTWFLSAAVLYVTAVIVPGFHIKSFVSALIAAIVVGLLNALIRPMLIFLTLPLNIVTLGLFTFVVNAIILRMAAGLLKGFDIDGWVPAMIGAVVFAFIQFAFFYFFGF